MIREQILALKYPDGTQYPIILRWFWEFNANASQIGNSPGPNNNGDCFVNPNSVTPNAPLTTQFINAWETIHNALLGSQPVPNVTFDWNPSVIPDTGSGQTVDVATPAPFYPGPEWSTGSVPMDIPMSTAPAMSQTASLKCSARVQPVSTVLNVWQADLDR